MQRKRKYKQSTIKNTKFIDSEALYKKFIDEKSPLVKIHDHVDFSFVNDLCDDVYVEDGQHAYLPELVFKVSFIQLYKGGLSDNEFVRQCKTNLEYRYFCDLAIDDEIFDDSKMSRFRSELGDKRFKQIFDMVVEKIKKAGFIDEKDVQYMDSFLFLADVKLVSINALLSKALQKALNSLGRMDGQVSTDAKKRDFELNEDEQKNRFVFLVRKAQKLLSSVRNESTLPLQAQKDIAVLKRIVKERIKIEEDGTITKKESKEEKDKVISVSDPDARMMGKDEKEIHPSYKSHVSMNGRGFITETDVTIATVYDGHHAYDALHNLKRMGFHVPACVGDNHFGSAEFRADVAEEGTQVIAPYRKNQTLNSCLTDDIMIEAWAYNHTEEYKEHRRIRAHIEPKQGEMKNLHGMKRAKFRGLSRVRIQNFLSAIVTNCKLFVAKAIPN